MKIIIFYIVIIILLIICILCYKLIKKQFISYTNLKNIFLDKLVGSDPNFINFGFWDGKYSLKQANEQLCKQLFNNIPVNKKLTILDVGCGYGKQDIIIAEQYSDAIIYCIDIEEEHIKKSKLLFERSKLSNNVYYKQGNACDLDFSNNFFDVVISLESAFHYNPRKKFFEEAFRVLKPGGCLLIADIIPSKENILCKVFQLIAKDLLKVPSINNQNFKKWCSQLEEEVGFLVKVDDVTDNTILPFFQYITENHPSIDNKLLQILSYIILSYLILPICKNYKPLTYVLAVCKKPDEYKETV